MNTHDTPPTTSTIALNDHVLQIARRLPQLRAAFDEVIATHGIPQRSRVQTEARLEWLQSQAEDALAAADWARRHWTLPGSSRSVPGTSGRTIDLNTRRLQTLVPNHHEIRREGFRPEPHPAVEAALSALSRSTVDLTSAAERLRDAHTSPGAAPQMGLGIALQTDPRTVDEVGQARRLLAHAHRKPLFDK